MAKIFEISEDIKSIAADAIEDLIDQLGKDCLLVYPPIYEDCLNCIFDEIGNKSSNHWKSGGSIPFSNGSVCPNCSGQGKHAIEMTKAIRLLISSDLRSFTKGLPPNIQVPDGAILTKGKMIDFADVLQCRKIIVQTGLQSSVRLFYKLYSEPLDTNNIAQGRFWNAIWERVPA